MLDALLLVIVNCSRKEVCHLKTEQRYNESLKSILKYGAGATAGAAMAGQVLESLRRQADLRGILVMFNPAQQGFGRYASNIGFKALGAAPGLNYEAAAELGSAALAAKRR